MQGLIRIIVTMIFVSAGAWAAKPGMVIHVQTPETIRPRVAVMLQEELAKRSGLELPIVETVPKRASSIELSTFSPGTQLPQGLSLPDNPEAYALYVTQDERHLQIHLVGRSSRGVLFAVGRLLREAKFDNHVLCLDFGKGVATAPAYAYRGHQVGYRHGSNSYDLWDLDRYEQYLRDLAIFGTNGIELTNDFVNGFTKVEEYADARNVKDGPLLAETIWEMNKKIAGLLDQYDMDVWLWEPLSGDVSIPEIAEAEMKWRREFYAEMPRIDHIFVPGGDPGRTHPDVLLPWLEKQAALLHEFFPKAGLWVSNQKFEPEENAKFFGYLKEKNPTWLAGLVYGPGTLLSVEECRELLPKQYPIRHYPDITHNVRCQYPVPGLDRIIAQTLDREGINPRPRQMQGIFNVIMPPTNGFVSYSDGVNDDLNKAVFSALAWDPQQPVEDIVHQYARVHFGESHAEEVAKCLFAFEKVFTRKLVENSEVEETLHAWKKAGRRCIFEEPNWRFDMYLFRATFDAYIRERAVEEQRMEKAAYDALREVASIGVKSAIEKAQAVLSEPDRELIDQCKRVELEQLGINLFREIGMQLSMDPPYHARNPERGALLDKLDRPLNDRPWLEAQFARILADKDESQQLRDVVELFTWEDAGPGGFYDDLGDVNQQPHLVRQTLWKDDPGFDHGPLEAHYRQMDNTTKQIAPLKLSWTDSIETPSRTPIVLRYDGLDPKAKYKVRATYFGRYGAVMRLVADEAFEISKEQGIPDPVWPVEFEIPQEATADGQLELAWHLVKNRGCQLAEVWLIREP